MSVRTRPLALLWLGLAVAPWPAAIVPADERPVPAITLPHQTRPPMPVAAIAGVWRTGSRPTDTVTIRPIVADRVVIVEDRFESTGSWDGREFLGTYTLSDGETHAHETGMLQVRPTSDRWLAVEFLTRGGLLVHREAWSRDSIVTDRAPRDRLDGRVPKVPESDDLPAFGAYVYVTELPEAIHRVPMDCTARGTVHVQALVDRDGRVVRTKVVKSVPGLDAAAEAAARQWRFKPAKASGKPVAVWVAVPLRCGSP